MLNKTLFFKDWRMLKWSSFLFLCMLILLRAVPAYIHLYAYTHSKEVADPHILFSIFKANLLDVNLSHIMINVAFAIATAVILFYDSRSRSYSLLASMPFSRSEIIATKLLSGALSIFLPYITMVLLGTGIYYKYLYHTTVGSPYLLYNIGRWFIMVVLVYFTVFFMGMMFQALLGNQIIAAIITGIMLFFPIGFLGMLEFLIDRLAGGASFGFYNLGRMLNIVEYTGYDFSRGYIFKIALLMILSIVFVEVTYIAYVRNHFEKNGQFSMFQPIEKVFVICFSISTSLLVTVILTLSSSFRYFGVSSIILLIVGFVLGLIFSTIMIKVLKKLSHRPK